MGPKIFFFGGGTAAPLTRFIHIGVYGASPLNTPLIGFVRLARNEAVKFVFQLVVDKVTTVHKSTTYNNKLYDI